RSIRQTRTSDRRSAASSCDPILRAVTRHRDRNPVHGSHLFERIRQCRIRELDLSDPLRGRYPFVCTAHKVAAGASVREYDVLPYERLINDRFQTAVPGELGLASRALFSKCGRENLEGRLTPLVGADDAYKKVGLDGEETNRNRRVAVRWR